LAERKARGYDKGSDLTIVEQRPKSLKSNEEISCWELRKLRKEQLEPAESERKKEKRH
jgi:hypothetical protein